MLNFLLTVGLVLASAMAYAACEQPDSDFDCRTCGGNQSLLRITCCQAQRSNTVERICLNSLGFCDSLKVKYEKEQTPEFQGVALEDQRKLCGAGAQFTYFKCVSGDDDFAVNTLRKRNPNVFPEDFKGNKVQSEGSEK